MHHDRDRVISVSLTEAEWRAFITRHPSPVEWLRARILEEVARGPLEATRDVKQVVYEAQLTRTSYYINE